MFLRICWVAVFSPFFKITNCCVKFGERRSGRGVTHTAVMVMLGADAGVWHVHVLDSIGKDFLI